MEGTGIPLAVYTQQTLLHIYFLCFLQHFIYTRKSCAGTIILGHLQLPALFIISVMQSWILYVLPCSGCFLEDTVYCNGRVKEKNRNYFYKMEKNMACFCLNKYGAFWTGYVFSVTLL